LKSDEADSRLRETRLPTEGDQLKGECRLGAFVTGFQRRKWKVDRYQQW
jgi:hypothetical protein